MLNVELALTAFGSPSPAIPSLVHKEKKPCYLSQTAGLHRFLILFKDYNTAAFFTGSGFSGAKIRRKNEICRENRRKTEKFGEKPRKTEKIRENQRKSEKNGKKPRYSEKIRENQRKSEKIRENQRLSVNFCAYPQELSVNLCAYL